ICETCRIQHATYPLSIADGVTKRNRNRINLVGWMNVFSSAQFLTSLQAPDGSFYETEAKLAHSPQKWLQEKTLIDRFYFTAVVPMRLSSLGCWEHPVIEPALKWLKLHWKDWELVTGTWYGSWSLLCLYRDNIELNESLYKHCYEYALNWLPHLKSQPLTWLLDALQGSGVSMNEPLVVWGIARLESLQN
ncbi:MAG: hypothetical protein C4B59_17850, partial [Candidatus Methanogaster sp.]